MRDFSPKIGCSSIENLYFFEGVSRALKSTDRKIKVDFIQFLKGYVFKSSIKEMYGSFFKNVLSLIEESFVNLLDEDTFDLINVHFFDITIIQAEFLTPEEQHYLKIKGRLDLYIKIKSVFVCEVDKIVANEIVSEKDIKTAILSFDESQNLLNHRLASWFYKRSKENLMETGYALTSCFKLSREDRLRTVDIYEKNIKILIRIFNLMQSLSFTNKDNFDEYKVYFNVLLDSLAGLRNALLT